MKKWIAIIVLCTMQAACSGQQPKPAERGALLSYEDLATEITVGLEAWDSGDGVAPTEEPRRSVL